MSKVERTAVDARVVDKAIGYIQKRVRIHRRDLAREVGGYLFVNIYGSDLRAVRTGKRTHSERCIRSIAADERTKLSERELRGCIHFYLTEKAHGSASDDDPPELSVWEWAVLWPLVDDPETLVTVATWMERENVPKDTVAALVRLVEPYTAAGGRLEDLLTEPPGSTPPATRVMRMARLAVGWLRNGPDVSPATRAKALDIIADIERLLALDA